jgi:N-ethylmaleimide reductase
VTDAVHNAGGRIFLQLWHVGRISHPSLQPGGRKPVAPSAVRPRGKAFIEDGSGNGILADFVAPRALTTDEVREVVRDYGRAAANARRAGFDGVEVHAANGYLIEQFLCSKTNRRTDAYGGSVENRARFLFEVLEDISREYAGDRIGVRLSPLGTFNDIDDANPEETFGTVAARLNGFGLGYLHVIRNTVAGDSNIQVLDERGDGMLRLMRERWKGTLMLCGDFDPDEAGRWLSEGRMDFAVFGRLFLANPDLPERLRRGAALNVPIQETLYGGGAQGYTDYPTLAQERGEAPREIVTDVDRAGVKPGTGDPMTETDRRVLVRRFWQEVATGRDFSRLGELVHENFMLHLGGRELWPRAMCRGWLERLLGRADAPEFLLDDLFAHHDRVVVRWRGRGRSAEGSAGQGAGRQDADSAGVVIFRVRDGKLREAWLGSHHA